MYLANVLLSNQPNTVVVTQLMLYHCLCLGVCIREMESLILSTQKTLPKSQIVINELLPRFYDNFHNRQVYETKRLKCNSMLHDVVTLVFLYL
jgi:hypothetical protein